MIVIITKIAFLDNKLFKYLVIGGHCDWNCNYTIELLGLIFIISIVILLFLLDIEDN